MGRPELYLALALHYGLAMSSLSQLKSVFSTRSAVGFSRFKIHKTFESASLAEAPTPKRVSCFFALLTLVCLAATGPGCGAKQAQTPARKQPPANLPEIQAKAEAGDPQAQTTIGELYLEGSGLPQDYQKAAEWFQKAADQGFAQAENRVGELYEAGRGFTHDEAQAYQWFKKAADQGLAAAQYNLASMYEFGRGVHTDQAQAAALYQRAAQQGDALSQFNLGQRYHLGLGVNTNAVAAYKWLTLASKNGIQDADAIRDDVASKMSRAEIREARQQAENFQPTNTVPTKPRPKGS